MSEHEVRPGPASLLRPTWFEIDLDAITHNLRRLRRMVGSGVAIHACRKRNASKNKWRFKIAKNVVFASGNSMFLQRIGEKMGARAPGVIRRGEREAARVFDSHRP